MFALPISIPCFTSIIFFIKIALKLSFFYKKWKISRAGGTAPTPPCLRRLGALPPDPLPPVAWGFASRPLKQPPHFEFLATHLFFNSSVLCANPTYKYPNLLFEYYLHWPQHTSARATFQLLCISKTKARNQRKVEYEIRLALSSTKLRICKLAL